MDYGIKEYWENRYENSKENKTKIYINEWYLNFNQSINKSI